jgi:hypothetical protein
MLQPYDHEELYLKVWEQPLVKVAEEYGVSAVALGKTCRKFGAGAGTRPLGEARSREGKR